MKELNLFAVYPGPKLSAPGEGHRIYPYERVQELERIEKEV